MKWFFSRQNKKPYTAALYKAIESRKLKKVSRLIREGVDINPVNSFPMARSPLLAAVNTGDVEMVRLLLDAGADRHCDLSHPDIPLYNAIQADRPEIVRLLLEHDPTHWTEVDPIRTISLAITRNASKVWKLFMELGFDPNEKVRHEGGQTLLFYTIMLESPSHIVDLLNYGARFDIVSDSGSTIYQFAQMCHPDMLPFLTPWESVLVKRVGRDITGMVKDFVLAGIR